MLMQCGHAPLATDANGKPVCPICAGIIPGAELVDESTHDYTGRKAKCGVCKNERDSSEELPFFYHRPDKAKDEYYCGCHGWD